MNYVFQFANSLNIAGTETVFMNWYRNIDRTQMQFDFGVNTMQNSPFATEIKQYGGRIFIIPQNSGFWGHIQSWIPLYRTLKSNGPYASFQTHSHWWAGVDCMIAALAGIPKRFTIAHCAQDTVNIPLFQKWVRAIFRLFIYRFSTERLAVSEAAGKALYGTHIPFRIIHNGIDLQKFAYNPVVRAQKRAELHLTDKLVIGHVGRFADEKNHCFLVDVFAEIHKQIPNTHLVLVGAGELKEAVRHKLVSLGLEQATTFVGPVKQIQDFYQAFDIFIFPSLSEGLGLAAVEAQTSGLPCFLSDTLPKEAFICNATPISLDMPKAVWANKIVQTQQNFVRTDCTAILRQAGFDSQEVGKIIQELYSK